MKPLSFTVAKCCQSREILLFFTVAKAFSGTLATHVGLVVLRDACGQKKRHISFKERDKAYSQFRLSNLSVSLHLRAEIKLRSRIQSEHKSHGIASYFSFSKEQKNRFYTVLTFVSPSNRLPWQHWACTGKIHLIVYCSCDAPWISQCTVFILIEAQSRIIIFIPVKCA